MPVRAKTRGAPGATAACSGGAPVAESGPPCASPPSSCLLALPALVRAQTQGVVQPLPVDDRYATDLFINLEECDPARNAQVEFRWNVTPEAGLTQLSGVFRVYAQNKPPTVKTDGTLAYCDLEDDDATSLKAGKVGEDIDSGVGGLSSNAPLSTSEMVTESGRTCASDSDGLPIYICIHFHPRVAGSGTAVDETPSGLASGTLTVKTIGAVGAGARWREPGERAARGRLDGGLGRSRRRVVPGHREGGGRPVRRAHRRLAGQPGMGSKGSPTRPSTA